MCVCFEISLKGQISRKTWFTGILHPLVLPSSFSLTPSLSLPPFLLLPHSFPFSPSLHPSPSLPVSPSLPPSLVPSSGIRSLQCILLKICLLLGVTLYTGVEFLEILEPDETRGWRARVGQQLMASSTVQLFCSGDWEWCCFLHQFNCF